MTKRADVNDEDKLTLPTMVIYSTGFKGPCGFVVHAPKEVVVKARPPVKRRKRKVTR